MSDIAEDYLVDAIDKFTEDGGPVPVENEYGVTIGQIVSVERNDDGQPVAFTVEEY